MNFIKWRGPAVPPWRGMALRLRLLDIEGVKVIFDDARNGPAYAALARRARGLASGHVVGVVSAPGDGRNEELLQVGAICGAGFDDLVIYEADNCGRALGETARLLTCGVRSANAKGRLHCKLDAQRAIRFGLGMCKPGDVLVCGCGATLKSLIEALRPAMPAMAQRLAA
jgi:cyanophycin synthetase